MKARDASAYLPTVLVDTKYAVEAVPTLEERKLGDSFHILLGVWLNRLPDCDGNGFGFGPHQVKGAQRFRVDRWLGGFGNPGHQAVSPGGRKLFLVSGLSNATVQVCRNKIPPHKLVGRYRGNPRWDSFPALQLGKSISKLLRGEMKGDGASGQNYGVSRKCVVTISNKSLQAFMLIQQLPLLPPELHADKCLFRASCLTIWYRRLAWPCRAASSASCSRVRVRVLRAARHTLWHDRAWCCVRAASLQY